MARLFTLLAAVLLSSCGAPATPPQPPPLPEVDAPGPIYKATPGGISEEQAKLLNARPYRFRQPKGYDAARPAPLVLLLHGYGASGKLQDSYFRLSELAEAKTFLLATPDGTPDPDTFRFWNATDACCNFFESKVDDVAYLNAIVDDVSAKFSVDKKRIFAIGHSNGGFMAHRLACDSAARFAAVVSFAGAVFKEPGKCNPSSPVAVLQVHGDQDAVIRYAGGSNSTHGQRFPEYPAAKDTVAFWAKANGCAETPAEVGPPLTLLGNSSFADTSISRHPGCKEGGAAELWTIRGGAHAPLPLSTRWAELLYSFCEAHPRP